MKNSTLWLMGMAAAMLMSSCSNQKSNQTEQLTDSLMSEITIDDELLDALITNEAGEQIEAIYHLDATDNMRLVYKGDTIILERDSIDANSYSNNDYHFVGDSKSDEVQLSKSGEMLFNASKPDVQFIRLYQSKDNPAQEIKAFYSLDKALVRLVGDNALDVELKQETDFGKVPTIYSNENCQWTLNEDSAELVIDGKTSFFTHCLK